MSGRIPVVMTAKRELLAGKAPGRWRAERRLRGEGFPGWETTTRHLYTFCAYDRSASVGASPPAARPRPWVPALPAHCALGRQADPVWTLPPGGCARREGHPRCKHQVFSLQLGEATRPRVRLRSPAGRSGGCSAGRVGTSRVSYVLSFLREVFLGLPALCFWCSFYISAVI